MAINIPSPGNGVNDFFNYINSSGDRKRAEQLFNQQYQQNQLKLQEAQRTDLLNQIIQNSKLNALRQKGYAIPGENQNPQESNQPMSQGVSSQQVSMGIGNGGQLPLNGQQQAALQKFFPEQYNSGNMQRSPQANYSALQDHIQKMQQIGQDPQSQPSNDVNQNGYKEIEVRPSSYGEVEDILSPPKTKPGPNGSLINTYAGGRVTISVPTGNNNSVESQAEAKQSGYQKVKDMSALEKDALVIKKSYDDWRQINKILKEHPNLTGLLHGLEGKLGILAPEGLGELNELITEKQADLAKKFSTRGGAVVAGIAKSGKPSSFKSNSYNLNMTKGGLNSDLKRWEALNEAYRQKSGGKNLPFSLIHFSDNPQLQKWAEEAFHAGADPDSIEMEIQKISGGRK